uniref:ABM domain-containing protein n=1 Tax=Mycena chlorophos TaxID=658473 RepID=A0ABQ0KWE9_MYCCL|nr:predicted protein [Mycena chlorophos]
MPFDKTLTNAMYNTCVALPDKVAFTQSFFRGGPFFAEKADHALQWFCFQYTGSKHREFATIGSFRSDTIRQAHVDGIVVNEVRTHRAGMLFGKPDQAPALILSNKVASTTHPVVGASFFFQPKAGQTEALREFLRSTILPAVEADPETRYWYAYEFPEHEFASIPWPEQQFAIFAFWDSKEKREKSLNAGPWAAALAANEDKLLEKVPEINPFDMISAYVNLE